MRRIGTLPSQQLSERFVAYLEAQGVGAQADPDSGAWSIWIHQEDQLSRCREELQEFSSSPDLDKYKVQPVPRPVEHAPVRKIKFRELRWDRPFYEKAPLTIVLIIASVAVTLATGFGRFRPPTLEYALLISAIQKGFGFVLPEVQQGEVWRLYTPMFLHFNEMHLLFNMLATFRLAGTIEFTKGFWRLLLLTLFIAPASHLAQYFVVGPVFGGMSGVAFGWFGYVWIRSELGDRDIHIGSDYVIQMLLFQALCSLGLLGPIANTAHIAGAIAGAFLAALEALAGYDRR